MQELIRHLEVFGYCLIEDAIPADLADRLAARYFALHRDAANRANLQEPGNELYQTLFGVLNLEEQGWVCAAHPAVLAVARHFLGPAARIGEACSKWVQPGAPRQAIHIDSTEDMPPSLLDQPWLINTIWMLTDFTRENGATLVAPMSHRLRWRPTTELISQAALVSVEGRRGSVLMWHGGTWHGAGANTTSGTHRMGLNIAYYPAWWNLYREDGHQPIWPEVFDRMPKELQELTRHKVGRQRADVYE
jgi:ectoine hydroxylase-related dioxygenase (phytanoyl-CoA dioxygenase family)